MSKRVVEDLQAKRKKLFDDMGAVLDTAKEEKRALSGGEKEKYDKMEADFNSLSDTIDTYQNRAKAEEKLNADVQQAIVEGVVAEPTRESEQKADDYRTVFEKLIKKGERALSTAEVQLVDKTRAVLNTSVGAEGGYVVPVEYQKSVIKKLYEAYVMRRFSTVRQTASTTQIPVGASKPTFGWIAENGAYPNSDTSFAQLTINAFKSGGIIKVSRELLSDSMIDLESYLTDQIVLGMADLEETAFVVGDGASKPTGIVTSASDSGIVTADATAITTNEILDLMGSLKTPYEKKGKFLLNKSTRNAIRKLQDANGQYVWQPSLQADKPDMLFGRAVEVSDNMAGLTADSKSVLFGDFSYYTIADRGAMTINRLNELYAGNGQVGYQVDARVDGKLTLAETVKFITQAS